MNKRLAVALLPLILLQAGCAVGPDYRRPTLDMPQQFGELPPGWQVARPADAQPKGDWWTAYNDPVLNDLVAQLDINSQTLKQAEALVRQASAGVDAAQAQFLPTLSANASAKRAGKEGAGVTALGALGNTHTMGLTASWEPDFWGSIRRQVESAKATRDADQASLEAARLSARATLATDYFTVRVLDGQRALYDRAADAYKQTLDITRNQRAVGMATDTDVALADSQWQAAQAQSVDLRLQREQMVHAIATLIGKPAGAFKLAEDPAWQGTIPALPATGVPADLLERRPDVAQAERLVVAANANVGVATAALFPSLTLSGSSSWQYNGFGPWFSAPTRIWSLGAGLTQPIFEGGLLFAQKHEAEAAYDGTVAAYRQTVLGAMQDVEDNLVALRDLDEEAKVQAGVVAASGKAATLAMNQYKAGIVGYLNVLTAQQTALSNERAAWVLTGRQLSAHVLLVRGLGGPPL